MDDLLVVFWIVLLTSVLVSADICFERSGFFTPNGPYDLNRRLMLSYLPSNVTANNGFYTTSTGQDPNRVYGLGMCAPGSNTRSCSDCIISSSARLLRNCTNQMEGIDWRMDRTLCLVRYSNRSFYGSLGMEILRSENYTRIFQDDMMTDLDSEWEALMIGLIDQASTLYYAAGTQKLESSISHVYGAVQCSRDLSLENCTYCLQQDVIEYRSCCHGRQGGIISRPSCFIRWEVYPFLALFDNMPPLDKDGKKISKGTIVAIVVAPVVVIALGFALWKRRKAYKAFTTVDDITTSGSLQFEFKTIEAATSNFHSNNKLGHGGFGEVYKGTLPNGAQVAVKRLSKKSGQGEEEFKNEVFLVAKLQHKNLVRLLGFSVKGEEKILVYEFLPNKSLDHFLFAMIMAVWRLWKDDSLLEMIDPAMEDSYDRCEVIRCIHIGLLCVQENPTDRPTMSTVFRMLTNISITLHIPQPPGFVFRVRSKSNPLDERLQSGPSTSISITCVSPLFDSENQTQETRQDKTRMDDLLFVVFWIVPLCSVLVSADICFERSGFFTPNGTYDLNRRLMLASLPSLVTANDGFYTTSTGQDPNRAYGLGMCVPGTDARSCSDCIISSSARLLRNCTNQMEGIDWRMDRTLCLVRYSNRSFYGSLGIEILRSENYTRDVQANMTDLEITWEALMIGLIDQASSLSYAAGIRKLESSISHVYSVVQCSKDVSLENCTHCLQENVIEYRSCCRGRQGGIISRSSCFIRWEVYPFLDLFDNIAPEKDGKKISTGTIVAIVVVPVVLLALGYALWERREAFKAFTTDAGDDITTSGSLQFEFKAIEAATSNFHNTNKLGHGGFGEVYKGTLPNGTQVAVKRLCKMSGQGEEEFKNEVFLVAKLQHKNLVRLLGFSVKGEEKILVWKLWNNDSLLDMIDPAMEENYDRCEVIRCIHIGLLCVQENHVDRPTMSTIYRMLTNASITLHMPQPPGFVFTVRSKSNPLEERSQCGPSTSISITCVSPR
ncbi:hypothetical protein IGI04_001296 [Brassica rapa subsp. trilocularis]|uniref:Uncharacterized protein n=1 Tax=Brassica rapa subsp. trilocularis TaxID=1813537 RepID=A0ABQ7NVH3_BRACM|nr:hypothetical protein IGI04_001296 [Brassica rapa subsp. trilocularis]